MQPLTYFEDLGARIQFFSRRGGVSPPPFDSLNVGELVGDELSNVDENRKRVSLFYPGKKLCYMNQIHGCEIEQAAKADRCDGSYTTTNTEVLTIQTADCQPTFFFDPKKKLLVGIHAGWKGQNQKIYTKALHWMRNMGSAIENVHAIIGPSLGPCHAQFVNYQVELAEHLLPYQIEGCRFDLWQAALDEIRSCGVQKKYSHCLKICTFCNKEYFSYRREKKTGRQISCAHIL